MWLLQFTGRCRGWRHLQANSEVINKSVMQKTGAGTQLELVMFESDISDMQHSDISPTTDIQVCTLYSVRAPCGLWSSTVPWFMCWFLHYINCLFVCLLNFQLFYFLYFFVIVCLLSYLFTFLRVHSLTYQSTSSSIDPVHFQVQGRRRRPNVAFVFWG